MRSFDSISYLIKENANLSNDICQDLLIERRWLLLLMHSLDLTEFFQDSFEF